MAVGAASEVHDVKVSERFAYHIESAEGFRAKAYRDINGHLTIGFGHKVLPWEERFRDPTFVMTREEATDLLRADVAEAERAVNRLVKVNLKQCQYDALVSFVYNIGQGAFARSTLLSKLNAGHCCAVPDQIRRWTNRGNAGMLARRNAEIAMYVGDV